MLLLLSTAGFGETPEGVTAIYKKLAQIDKQLAGVLQNKQAEQQQVQESSKIAAHPAAGKETEQTGTEQVALMTKDEADKVPEVKSADLNKVTADEISLQNILALRTEIDSILRDMKLSTGESVDETQSADMDALALDLNQLRGTVDEIRSRKLEEESALLDKIKVNSQFEMSLYGFVKVEAFFDNSEVAKGDWLLFATPGGSPQSGQQVFSMNARHLRVGSKIKGPEIGTNGRINALVEVDFAGGFPNSSTAARQPQLRLRHAWVEMNFPRWEARFGQDWALIAGPFPNTTSFVVGAGKGNLWMRYPQVKGTFKFKKAKFAVSLNRPMDGNVKYDDYAGGSFDIVGDGERTGLPWVMWRQWVDLGPATLSASGHYGKERIPDLSSAAHTMSTYSFNADAIISKGPLSFTVRGFYGRNLNSFFGGVFQGYTNDEISVSNIAARGGWGQVVYKFHPKWSVTAGGGVDDPQDRDLKTGMRSRNDWLFGNVAFTPIKPLVFMLEADRLKTSYIGDKPGNNNRLQFVTYFYF
jgi:hypothetical protein